MSNRLLHRAALLAAVVGLSVGGFFSARAFIGLANPPPPQPPVQVGAPLDPGPPYNGVVNGIKIVPVGKQEPSDFYCTGDRATNAPYDVARGTVWEIKPTYLPAGAVEYLPGYVPDPTHADFAPVTLCDGEIIARSFRQFLYQGNDGAWVELSIAKARERSLVIDASAGRISSLATNGRPAVFVAPAPRDDLGESYIVIAEDFGETLVRGLGLSQLELLKVAEGLK